jgi:hypothetical protein
MATIIWFSIATGVTAGLSYNKEENSQRNQQFTDIAFDSKFLLFRRMLTINSELRATACC